MRHQTTRDLFRYWNTVRGERASPERDALDPTAFRQVLADTFLIEVANNGTFPLRLSGTRVDALWLADQKGRDFLDFWGDDSQSVAAALRAVMDGVVPVVLGARTVLNGRMPVDAEGLLLPLRVHGKTHSLLLGALSLAKPPGWIGLMPIDRLQLKSMRVLRPADVVDLSTARHLRESTAPLERRAHLTVYPGGRANA